MMMFVYSFVVWHKEHIEHSIERIKVWRKPLNFFKKWQNRINDDKRVFLNLDLKKPPSQPVIKRGVPDSVHLFQKLCPP